MKRKIVMLILMMVSVLAVNADELNTEQLKLRLDIFKYLKENNYNPEIDSDGDVKFSYNDETYYVLIDARWIDPFIVSIMRDCSYSDDCDREAVINCLSLVGDNKSVKIVPYDKQHFTFRTEVFCKDATVIKHTINRILREMQRAENLLQTLVDSDMASIDLSNPDSIFSKAHSLYLKDEDKKAFRLFNMLDNMNYGKAYSYLASCYKYGYGTDKDPDKMIEYYKKSYEKMGDMSSAYQLASYYLQGENYTMAYDYFQKCANIDGEYKYLGLYNLGNMEEKGYGRNSDLDKAKSYYRKSLKYSRSKTCDARKALMRLNETIEVKTDFVDATKTMLANMTPEEMYQKGREYEYGLNKRFVSLPKAYAYYKAAADNGYTNAFLKMGEIFIDEYYPFNDKATSDKWYQKAYKIFKKQEDKDGNACYQIGLMYENGYGVAKDVNKAKECYLQGANLKDSKAAWKYGLCLKEENEYTDAAKYFEQAAEDGNGDAMYELAYLYEVGYGVYQSRSNAVYWYKKSYNTWDDSWKKAKEALIRLGEYKVRN